MKRGTKWHGGHPFCKMPRCTATLDSWQTLSWQIRSCRAHIFTPRTWIHIPNSCYRRHDISFTDSQKKRWYIQSSKSGCQSGHYKTASFDHYLSGMHVAKLTLAASTGIPLACWGNGLTILLEKVFRNIFIDKMWAICLLEADYNWLNKFVFEKEMMDKAFGGDIIPVEQFAKRGSQATEGVLTSGLFCNIAQALHKTTAIESVDLANCFDAVAHLIASIALQSFKVCSAQNHDLVFKEQPWTFPWAWARAMVQPPRAS